MKKKLYVPIISVAITIIALFLFNNYRDIPYRIIRTASEPYTLKDFCVDLNTHNIDFYIQDFSHNLFLSDKSKEIKTDNDSIYIYVYKNNLAMESDSTTLSNYQSKLKNIVQVNGSTSFFYKKDMLIVQYSGNNSKIKNSLDSILGLSFF